VDSGKWSKSPVAVKADLEAAAGVLSMNAYYYNPLNFVCLAKAAAEQRLQEKRIADGLRPVINITSGVFCIIFSI
jgi:hypothetical protein